MKRGVFGVLLAITLCGTAKGQSVADDITQLTLDVEKLAQLKQVLSDMYKAYTVLYKGYEDIKNVSQGTFDLHKAFLDGLLAISPAVANYQKITSIINNQAAIVSQYTTTKSYFKTNGHFTSQELDYLSTVYTNLFNQSLTNLDELIMVITADQLRMSDAERLAAIDRLDRDTSGKLRFLQQFNNQAVLQSGLRNREQQDIGSIQSLYGITP